MDLHPVGLILTGGASRRMGRDKATMPVDGTAMAARVAAAATAGGCAPVVAVGGSSAALHELGLEVVPDSWPGAGPLGGLLSGSAAHAGRGVLVLACDLPWITVDVVASMVTADHTIDVAVANSGRREPLCSRWSPAAIAIAARCFADGERAVHHAIAAVAASGLGVADLPVAPEAMRNVNTLDDLLR